jgi:hypothetical protein
MSSTEKIGGYIKEIREKKSWEKVSGPRNEHTKYEIDKFVKEQGEKDTFFKLQLAVVDKLNETINIDFVRDSVISKALKAGVKKEDLNTSAIATAYQNIGDFFYPAFYETEDNSIHVVVKQTLRHERGLMRLKEDMLPDLRRGLSLEERVAEIAIDPEVRVLFIHFIAHEFVHALTRVREKEISTDHGIWSHSEAGYEYRRYKNENDRLSLRETLFAGFNEGVTERMAQEVVADYVNNSDDPHLKDTETLLHSHISSTYQAIYPEFTVITQLMCEKIGKSTGRDWREVWDYFSNGAFTHGRHLFDSEMRKKMDVIFGEGFMDELSKLKPRDHKRTKKFFNTYLSKKLSKKIPPNWSSSLGLKPEENTLDSLKKFGRRFRKK